MQRQAVSSVPASGVLAHGFTHLNSLNFVPAPHQLTAAQSPSQLALLLSSTLADADALCRELTVTQGRAPSGANGEREREKDMKAESKVLESAKAVLDTEARAERAERSHADLAELLQSLCAQFTKSNGTNTRAPSFRRRVHCFCAPPLDGVVARSHPSDPTASSSESLHFSAWTKTTLSPCLPFLCRTPSGLRPPEIACSPDQAHIPRHLRHSLPCNTPTLCQHLITRARREREDRHEASTTPRAASTCRVRAAVRVTVCDRLAQSTRRRDTFHVAHARSSAALRHTDILSYPPPH
ncbi:hypothetical protein DFH11DRAFT_1883678 [Phellopilus nigrolimitatus]|nr:hypothetical protein DFH11DRAFT_1883678 [Phellopilus nigrolimitatus]